MAKLALLFKSQLFGNERVSQFSKMDVFHLRTFRSAQLVLTNWKAPKDAVIIYALAPFVQAILNYTQTLTESQGKEHGGDPTLFVRKQGGRSFIFKYLRLRSLFSNRPFRQTNQNYRPLRQSSNDANKTKQSPIEMNKSN